jgi:hypothetical protein
MDLDSEEVRGSPALATLLDDALAVVLVYDITRRETFLKATGVLHQAARAVAPDAFVLLLGAHADREEERQVTPDEAEAAASRLRIAFLECSARTGTNMSLAQTILRLRLLRLSRKPPPDASPSALPPLTPAAASAALHHSAADGAAVSAIPVEDKRPATGEAVVPGLDDHGEEEEEEEEPVPYRRRPTAEPSVSKRYDELRSELESATAVAGMPAPPKVTRLTLDDLRSPPSQPRPKARAKRTAPKENNSRFAPAPPQVADGHGRFVPAWQAAGFGGSPDKPQRHASRSAHGARVAPPPIPVANGRSEWTPSDRVKRQQDARLRTKSPVWDTHASVTVAWDETANGGEATEAEAYVSDEEGGIPHTLAATLAAAGGEGSHRGHRSVERATAEEVPTTRIDLSPGGPSPRHSSRKQASRGSSVSKKRERLFWVDVFVGGVSYGRIPVRRDCNPVSTASRFVREAGLGNDKALELSRVIRSRMDAYLKDEERRVSAVKRRGIRQQVEAFRAKTTQPKPFAFALDKRAKDKREGGEARPVVCKLTYQVGVGSAPRIAKVTLRLWDDPDVVVERFRRTYGLALSDTKVIREDIARRLRKAAAEESRRREAMETEQAPLGDDEPADRFARSLDRAHRPAVRLVGADQDADDARSDDSHQRRLSRAEHMASAGPGGVEDEEGWKHYSVELDPAGRARSPDMPESLLRSFGSYRREKSPRGELEEQEASWVEGLREQTPLATTTPRGRRDSIKALQQQLSDARRSRGEPQDSPRDDAEVLLARAQHSPALQVSPANPPPPSHGRESFPRASLSPAALVRAATPQVVASESDSSEDDDSPVAESAAKRAMTSRQQSLLEQTLRARVSEHPVVMELDLEFAENEWATIVVRQGDSVPEIAKSFCETHGIDLSAVDDIVAAIVERLEGV